MRKIRDYTFQRQPLEVGTGDTHGMSGHVRRQGSLDHGPTRANLQIQLISEMAMGDWKEERDPRTGRTYFVNPITRASQWVRPGVSDFLEQQGIVQTEKPLPTVDVGGARKEHTAADDADAEPEAEVHMMLNLWKI